MSERFRAVDRDTPYLLPPSVQDWLPEEHLARFVVEVVSKLDLRDLEKEYAGRGSKAYHPEMLLALLFYGYATGVFASRKLEQATWDSLAFRYIAANTHPDHDTIAAFREAVPEAVEAVVRADSSPGADDGVFEAGQDQSGWEQGPGECIET